MSDNSVYEEDYKGYHIVIEPDNADNNSPRDWDNLGTIATWHRRYSLGDVQPDVSPIDWMMHKLLYNYEDKIPCGNDYAEDWLMDDDKRVIYQFLKYFVMLPIYAYEHGGITISTHRTGQMCDTFDSGQLGFIYVEKKKILKEFSKKHWTKKLQDKTEDILIGEVQTYDDYLTGSVYGYLIYALDNDDNQLDCVDSCWGFYPELYNDGKLHSEYEYCLYEARSHAEYYAKEQEKLEELLTKRMLNQEV